MSGAHPKKSAVKSTLQPLRRSVQGRLSIPAGKAINRGDSSRKKRDEQRQPQHAGEASLRREADGLRKSNAALQEQVVRGSEALRESEELLRLAHSAGKSGPFDWDIVTGRVQWTPETERAWGLRPGEFRGTYEHWRRLVHPKDLPEAERLARKAITDPKAHYEVEHRVISPDGSVRWLYATATTIWKAGKPVRMVGLNMDITGRKQAEIDLKQSEAKYRRLYETLHDAFASVDMEGRIVECNSTYAKMLGYSENELRWKTYQDLTPRKWHQIEKQIIRRQVLAFGYSSVYEKEYRRKDGTVFPVELRTSLIRDEDGRPQGMWAIVRDVTARKEAESRLRDLNLRLEQRVAERTDELLQREERLRAILNTVVDAVITIDEFGSITGVNPATERMFGYSEAEMLGRNVEMLMPPPYREEHSHALENYHRTGKPKIIGITGREVLAQRKDGTVFPVEIAVSEVDHLRVFTGVIRDITERRKLENALLEAVEREQRRFGRDLHDGLGQRLTGLEMLSHALALDLKSRAPSFAKRALRLNEELRDTVTQARLLSHNLAPVTLHGGGLMQSLEELARSASRIPKTRCIFTCKPPVYIRDPGVGIHLYRIAQEAVNNALKHGRAPKIEIKLTQESGAIVLSVENNGRAFSKSAREEGGLGLHAMRYRASVIGAALRIEKGGRSGVRVICSLRTIP